MDKHKMRFILTYGSSKHIDSLIDQYKSGKISKPDIAEVPMSKSFTDEHADRLMNDVPESIAYHSRSPKTLDKLVDHLMTNKPTSVGFGHIATNPAVQRSTIDKMLSGSGSVRRYALSSHLIGSDELTNHYDNAKTDNEKYGILLNKNATKDLFGKVMDDPDVHVDLADFASSRYHGL